MRKLILAGLLFLCFVSLTFLTREAAWAAAPAPASNPSPVALTPEQARRALQVLNDPKARAQLSDTLRAIAAAGALSAPPASGAAAATPASAASGVMGAIAANGLASQVSHQVVGGLREVGAAVRRSTSALLDMPSARAWWIYEIHSPWGRAQLSRLAWTLPAVLFPAWFVGAVLARALKKRIALLAARSEATDTAAAEAAAAASTTANHSDEAAPKHSVDIDAERAERAQRNAAYAGRHWSLLQRLPFSLLHVFLRALPVALTVGIAITAMSMLTEDGTPEASVLESLIEIYAIARGVVLAGSFLFAPNAARLRLLRLSDQWAAFGMRWIVRLAVVLGIGAVLAATPVPLGLTPDAHLGIVKLVTLTGHVMVTILILQIRRPVAEWMRGSAGGSRPFAFMVNWLADAWAGIAVFFVIALWFVWALDVRNGYRLLLHHGGTSVLILIGARLAGIVTFGVLGRIFKSDDDESEKGSIAVQRALRYYPLLRRLISIAIVLVAANFVLGVWGVDVWQSLIETSVGRRFVSACMTIAIATLAALLLWEAINVSIERRLHKWTAAGDLARAARLRTLLPMFRTTLLIGIGLVVGLTGLSEIGVNIAPLLAGASIFGVALGFGSQKLVQDFITGMFLLMENALQVGDWVTVAGVSGTVEYLSIRTVRLRGSDGSLYTVPFSSVSTVNNTNRGLGNAAVKVSIAYGQDVDRAIATLKEIGAALREDPQFKDGIVSDFSFWGVDQVDGAMVALVGQIQCRDSSRWPVQREFNRRILETFRARGIEIANPLRSVMVPYAGAAAQPGVIGESNSKGASDAPHG
ncbi:mechanosensitive ion channel domain-containing protein [Trinickia fusca]|uniref:Mechanosensitive ion channel protein n=1 Tax=Trinickia fusca TaxID=2419777 RepID=A0A494XA52_9BURK|nr:mechanosensitive ion channel domain-containing protein [Trinickia fusca]RKP47635.1 mechanosensitive ion channel protein [Trinickia fusca]